jgi:hypothetical protein
MWAHSWCDKYQAPPNGSSPSLATPIARANMLAASLKQRRKHQASSCSGINPARLAELYTHACVLPSSCSRRVTRAAHRGAPGNLFTVGFLPTSAHIAKSGLRRPNSSAWATSPRPLTSLGENRGWRRAHAGRDGTLALLERHDWRQIAHRTLDCYNRILRSRTRLDSMQDGASCSGPPNGRQTAIKGDSRKGGHARNTRDRSAGDRV